MKGKFKLKSTKIPSPFGTAAHKTERTAVAILSHWMREIIAKKNLALGMPDVETIASDGKMPDTVIYESARSQKVLCVIEAKPAYYDVFDEQELKRPACQKANERKAKYFATTNFKRLIWFNTAKVNALRPEEEQIVEKFWLSELEDLDDIEQARYSDPTKKALEDFLTKLVAVHTGKQAEPKQAIDEFLILRLQEKIRVLSGYYRGIVDDQCHKDPPFAKSLKHWFVDQRWSFTWQPDDFEKAARQTAYLLVNKILFYNLLQAKRPQELDPLEIPEGMTKGSMLRSNLQTYFNEVLKIDYETIYTTDFIDGMAFPDVKEVVKEVKELVSVLRRYDFSKLGFDVIGRIFESLIPERERHNLGQYFTSADVVDLILRFCLQHEDDKILDPACGAGTFLVRAYQHKKLMNQRMKHQAILATLWGDDIAKFPAHLATINLAINDLGTDENYPNIIQEDFFKLLAVSEGFEAPVSWRKARAKTLRLAEREVIYPRWFDAIVGNPPYTRQEEIPETGVDKEQLIENALKVGSLKVADISKRAGIHAYFFVHGTKFLRDGGHFGFIVSDSWLDAEFGKGLQEFFLRNYRIIAIIESKVERWFQDADVNTCIVVLQKCKEKKKRDENLVRFVFLKKPLRNFIPPAHDMWEKQVQRLESIDRLKRTVLGHGDLYENDELRILPKRQEELWKEGFGKVEQAYVGAKWGKYLRAPQVFFRILERAKRKLVPLQDVADLQRGFTTGADPWFYVSDVTSVEGKKKVARMARAMGCEKNIGDLVVIRSGDGTDWLIEKQYVFPVIRNPEDYRRLSIDVAAVRDFVIIVPEPREKLKGKAIARYIIHGERKAYHMGKDRRMIPAETASCSVRKYWHQLPDIKPARILWQKAFDVYHRHYFASRAVHANQRFYPIYPHRASDAEIIAGFLNCPLVPLYLEFQRGIMGLGAIEATVEEVSQMLILNPAVVTASAKSRLSKALKALGAREVGSVFDELGASSPQDVSLAKVRPDRRELDRVILEHILGLTEDEQLDLYRALVDLVRSRIQRAKSVRENKRVEGIDTEALKSAVVEHIKTESA